MFPDPLSVVVPADHFHGHSSKAAIVRVVSRQLDNVLVEQNHCHGFRTVAANYHAINISSTMPLARDAFTYCCPCSAGICSIDADRQLPRVVITDSGDHSLCGLGNGDKKLSMCRRGGPKDCREEISGFVEGRKEEGVEGGSQLVPPFLVIEVRP